ncbi:MAG: glucokinase [Aphanizomenon sp.]|jgi:glucokinase|uniref:Glucokinase n=1 Tax=Aphanizomenon flos-aquae WA102 TaxID=1710896 RepID=A0A1B7WZZ8_APHFL|nr:glucokinase [Aphanizomenon flos-aquae Clear-A1]MDJ0505707.1 glucokinase [Nostocales cyanobacterium LE14-WE12]NTW20988.1 glucokinase [Nostocales cyanobacterium W4_Combined_metabat2_030]OBQ19783.1 MAG: glucokinase [Anabaena sp. WA113]OBQ29329.1 MAG: glucokinase [Aphanizomenon flos-aquae MDT14a]OBQ42686.1 MAG: glucokinase [Aphanizomenon flos-aquae WA102]QSV68292.1 MAG: glucokinase [Aphanizomenon flos-aquae DEX188]
MTLLLAGDIGGTKTILRLVESSETLGLKTLYEESFRSGDFPDLVPMVQKFLTTANSRTPEKACFAIAGPVVKNTAKLTNLTWFLDKDRLIQELGIPSVSLINDFAAVGYGIFGLTKQDLLTLQVGKYQPAAPMAVIGAGTGLGQGFLIRQDNQYQVFPSEGGHADFAPRNELEFQLLKYLVDKHDIQRVSVERVVSGLGITSIYQFLRDRQIAPESPEIAQAVRTWEQEAQKAEKTVDPGAFIGSAALQKSDRLSEQTMQLFIEVYGAEAGNLALKLLPYGGLYIAGGIAPKILPLMENGSFLLNFTQKGRMGSLLEEIPVHIILNQQVGLIGAAFSASRL